MTRSRRRQLEDALHQFLLEAVPLVQQERVQGESLLQRARRVGETGDTALRAAALRCLAQDRGTAKFATHMVMDGTGGGRMFDHEDLLATLLWRASEFDGPLESAISELLTGLWEFVDEPETTVKLFAPVTALRPSSSRIDLSPNLAFERVPTSLRGGPAGYWQSGATQARYGFTRRVKHQRWSDLSNLGAEPGDDWSFANDAVFALQALSLVRHVASQIEFASAIGPTWLEEAQSVLTLGDWGMTHPHAPRIDVITESDELAWCQAIDTLSQAEVKRRHFFGLAIRRFADAQRRAAFEDRIIDLSIAAEALFLTQTGSELSFRLQTRAAVWLGKDKTERRDVAARFKRLYDARSKIVHGDTPPPDCARVAGEAEADLRVALLSAAEWCAAGRAPADGRSLVDDWDGWVLAGASPRQQ